LLANSVGNIAVAEENCISVFSPMPTKNYRPILKDITSGITQNSSVPIKIYDVDKNTDKNIAINNPCNRSIGIGRIGMQYALHTKRPSIAGALFIPAGKKTPFDLYSLIPSPAELFERLKHFSPKTKTVTVVYSNKYSATLIQKAKQQAPDYNLNINAVASDRIQDSLKHYQQFFKQAKNEVDALWILQDPITIDKGAVLEYILEKAWDNDILIFSSQAALAKKGALFSVYPDNFSLGKRLALASTSLPDNREETGKVKLLIDLYTAFNRRTASHLNLQNKRGKYIDQIFPQ
jgi:putative ABC transport system substrate-binding protein